MAHVIKLKYGSPASWSYVDLTDVDHGIVDYHPGTPSEGADDMTESGIWQVAGSSAVDLVAKVREIEQVFYRAGAYNLDGIGAYQVWLTMLPDSAGGAAWESQIYEGRLELTEDIFGVDWSNRATDVVLIWRRTAWWEQYQLLGAANDNGGPLNTQIYNRGDSSGSSPTKKENWIDLSAATVTGDLPAPAAIQFTPTGSLNDFVVFHNARTLPTITGLAEGETGSGDTVDANRSGGKYKNYTTPVGGATGVDVTKAATALSAVVTGAWIRFMLSAYFTGTIYVRPFIEIGGKRYYGPKNTLVGSATFHLYDLGMVRMPAGSFNGATGYTSGFSGFNVGVNMIAASAIVVSVDYFHYIPVDSYARGILDVNTAKGVILDTRAGMVLGNSDFGVTSYITSIGTLYGGIWLEPNLAQRLTFKMTVDGLDTMANEAMVYVYAWLRKRTL